MFPASAPFFSAPNAIADPRRPTLSVVVPMFNEEGAATRLLHEIHASLKSVKFEIIAVDDNSADETLSKLLALRREIPMLRVIAHGSNSGQSRAIRSGVLAARAPVVATLDGDGQNDPADIAKLVVRLTRPEAPRTLAMAAGERIRREDTPGRKWASSIANAIRSRLLRDGARDTGCGLKVFYREAFLRLPAFDHMHRYLPALMRREGFSVEFAPVGHRPRMTGKSNYSNIGRLAVSFRDLFGVMWLISRARSPGEISEL